MAKWLDERRNQRAEARRIAQEERIAAIYAENEEKKRIEAMDREAAKKAADEAAAKKAKKDKDKKGKK